MLLVEVGLLRLMIPVHDEAAAFHHRSRHLKIVGTQVEVRKERHQIGRQAPIDVV